MGNGDVKVRGNWVSVVELENFASVMRERRRRLPSRSRLNCVYESVGKTETLGELRDRVMCSYTYAHICVYNVIGVHTFLQRDRRKRCVSAIAAAKERDEKDERTANGRGASESERETYRNAQTKACRLDGK